MNAPSPRSLKLLSPAKVNLFLRIVDKRPDGYHELASLFQAISLYDILHLELSEQDRLTCTESSLPTDGRNLILQAAHLFRQKTGLSFGLRVHLEKNIPHQAGLGGGSSNAATTLWGLNQLLGHPASLKELIQWSVEIGSDISFFLSQGTAYCTGRGEEIHTLDPLPQRSMWIVKPPQGLSTPAVYSQLRLDQLVQRDPKKALQDCLRGESNYFNDLESSAYTMMPSLRQMQAQLLASGFHTVVMSGSGSAFFCLGPGKPNQNDWFCQPVQFVNRKSNEWFYDPVKRVN